MRLLIPLFALLIPVGSRQDRTVSAAITGSKMTVRWTAPRDHDAREWVGIYRPGASVVPVPPGTLWKYVPAGESGEMTFDLPESGEWEARYLSPANMLLAAALAVSAESARSQLRKLTYYENGIRLWETETMDDTEAARHITNVSLSTRKGIEARIEVRYATVTYSADPDEVGTWKK